MEVKRELKERKHDIRNSHIEKRSNISSDRHNTFCSSQRTVRSDPQYKGFLWIGSYVSTFLLPENITELLIKKKVYINKE